MALNTSVLGDLVNVLSSAGEPGSGFDSFDVLTSGTMAAFAAGVC